MDGTAFDKDVFLAVDTVTDGGSDIEVEVLYSNNVWSFRRH